MTDDKKHSPHKRQYAVLSRQTIRTFAEAAGNGADMPDEIASVLAEDVVYRLRELVQVGCQYMEHGKRRKLSVADLNRALLQKDCAPICGHGSPDSVHWVHVKEAEVTAAEDNDVLLGNFACNSELPTRNGNVSLQAQWIAVEGFQKTNPASNTPVTSAKPRNLLEELQHHYELLTKAILSCDSLLTHSALEDLKTNTRIVPLLRNLVNFITNGIRKLNHDPCRLLCLLYAVNSLLRNKIIYLESQPYMAVLVDCVRHCAVEPLSQSSKSRFDQWIMRDYAARLLAFMIQSVLKVPVIKLKHQVTQGLNKILADPTKPFCSHYGAVSILTAIGAQSFEKCVLPHVVTLWSHLQTAIEDCSKSNVRQKMDAIRVCGAIQVSVDPTDDLN
ncbi:hypothetical protein CAPTEDRAFT_177124 [Capitella teleta]|uniref:Histone H4 n=1 Tax=Capitella teleta TaxID=283909 RepID=R7T8U7_CAPTE|nr:hypothetical protein CAPTEDRAFT_177124 [Capitella teleta]|eukprot:ELT89843.1 hypothetical protein CAPTEDRAFT_177124 [Capitella teleta]